MSELRTIARHAGTVLVGQLAVMAFGVTDTIVAGRYSEQALAALSVGSAVYISVFVALMGVLQALLPTWAELHGGMRHEDLGRSVRQALYLAVLGMLAGGWALLFPGALLRWTEVPLPLQAEVREYLAVLVLALPAALLFRMYSTLNQSLGKPLLVTWLQALSLLVKVPLTIWFAFGGLGLAPQGAVGCAWATVLVNYLFLGCAVWLLRTQPLYRPYAIWRRIERPDWQAIAHFARLGVPGGLAVMVEVTSFTLMALFIARQGMLATAAHQVAANLAAVLYMVPLSIAIATSARVSYWLGAANPSRARLAIRTGFKLGLALALALSAVVALGRWRIAAHLLRQSRGRGRGGGAARLACGLPHRGCHPGPVRVRAALLPRRGRAPGRVLRAALGCRAGRRLRAGLPPGRGLDAASTARPRSGLPPRWRWACSASSCR